MTAATSDGTDTGGMAAVDDVELLRRFCINGGSLGEVTGQLWLSALDRRTASLVRIGTLIAGLAPEASIRPAVDEAIAAGASSTQIIAVLDCTVDIAGLPHAVAAAPKIARALGLDEDLSESSYT